MIRSQGQSYSEWGQHPYQRDLPQLLCPLLPFESSTLRHLGSRPSPDTDLRCLCLQNREKLFLLFLRHQSTEFCHSRQNRLRQHPSQRPAKEATNESDGNDQQEIRTRDGHDPTGLLKLKKSQVEQMNSLQNVGHGRSSRKFYLNIKWQDATRYEK